MISIWRRGGSWGVGGGGEDEGRLGVRFGGKGGSVFCLLLLIVVFLLLLIFFILLFLFFFLSLLFSSYLNPFH